MPHKKHLGAKITTYGQVAGKSAQSDARTHYDEEKEEK